MRTVFAIFALLAFSTLAAAQDSVSDAGGDTPEIEANGDGDSVCDPSKTGFKDETQQVMVCYAGTFLVKMLSELNAGEAKSSVHVRTHLLPYLAGQEGVDALATDKPSDPSCTVCMTDKELAKGTEELRATMEPKVVQKYDALSVCYSTLTDRIINELPKDKDEGVMLVPSEHFKTDPLKQVVSMFRALLVNHAYNGLSCRINQRAPRPRSFFKERLGGRKNVHNAVSDDQVGNRMGGIMHGFKNMVSLATGKKPADPPAEEQQVDETEEWVSP
eukprot:CAMPEP_0118930294 /NCGR_PEP_ID=MMETSP1169-20130426/7030_1 /TAXON_ID=36882 /ORGANISM="Pyramimonas obovata, Strain CCMP722" /LENGTH=273 /DNA_ID=CAMNT_0006872623 /DNA_START=134 /DNA_END=952 /DNA_ORIENTATION=-